jgi:hypothetical protein
VTFASWYDLNEQKYKISIQIDEGELLELNLTREEHEQYFGGGDETPMGTRLRLMAELMDRLDELHTVRFMAEPKRRK